MSNFFKTAEDRVKNNERAADEFFRVIFVDVPSAVASALPSAISQKSPGPLD